MYDRLVAKVVFLLGAGFNCSIVDPDRDSAPRLATNFFQVYLADRHLNLNHFRQQVYIDVLLEEIERYWHLNLDALRVQRFDIEECMTLFESQAEDANDLDAKLRRRHATFALRQMLLTYLGNLSLGVNTPTARQFGADVLTNDADVLTFNYDTIAEDAIALASGIGPKRRPASLRSVPPDKRQLSDADLDVSHTAWKATLAMGFRFDEVPLPLAGVPIFVDGGRYFAHPKNQLYLRQRVLKLHGSLDWLK
jgi:hypothetical protein